MTPYSGESLSYLDLRKCASLWRSCVSLPRTVLTSAGRQVAGQVRPLASGLCIIGPGLKACRGR
jgi:hypothetical protein